MVGGILSRRDLNFGHFFLPYVAPEAPFTSVIRRCLSPCPLPLCLLPAAGVLAGPGATDGDKCHFKLHPEVWQFVGECVGRFTWRSSV